MGSAWWDTALQPTLSQGDVLIDVPFGTLTSPPKYLIPAALKTGASGWSETLSWTPDKNGMGQYLDRGRQASVMVLSYGCEIDKPSKTTRVQIGLLSPLAKLSPEEQEQVKDSTAYHSLMLPDVPVIGDHYLDLRCITFVPGEVATQFKRVASMTDAAVQRLQAQIVGYFTRIDLATVVAGTK